MIARTGTAAVATAATSAIMDRTELPIECRVNLELLLRGVRRIVQFDTTYYARRPCFVSNVCMLLDDMEDRLHAFDDAMGNIIVVNKHDASIVRELMHMSKDGTVEGAFQTPEFAKLLDSEFYIGHDASEWKEAPRCAQVSMQVMDGAHGSSTETQIGSILVQMCPFATLAAHMPAIYARYEELSKVVAELQPGLQAFLVVHTKGGAWKDSPEWALATAHRL